MQVLFAISMSDLVNAHQPFSCKYLGCRRHGGRGCRRRGRDSSLEKELVAARGRRRYVFGVLPTSLARDHFGRKVQVLVDHNQVVAHAVAS